MIKIKMQINKDSMRDRPHPLLEVQPEATIQSQINIVTK
jgi:hypothetical protein